MGFEVEQSSVPGLIPLCGAIFMSNTRTMEECLTRELFGLPSSFSHFVKQVRAGMILFLFDYETRLLHGVFQACSNGALNIVPDAYRSFGRQYPAQVEMTPIWHCSPLSEDEFRDAIKENYFSAYKFRFGLSEKQVRSLLSLFNVRKLKDLPFQRQSSRNNSSSTSQCSVGSEIRYIDDNRCKLKERIIDKPDVDDNHVLEISEDSLKFMERDKVHTEQKVSDDTFPDFSTRDYYLPTVPVRNNNTLTDIRSVRYSRDKNIERGLTPAEHSPLGRFTRNNDGRIDKLVNEYAEGCEFIPLTSFEQPHLVSSDFSTSFCHNKSLQQSDQFKTTSVVHCDIESQNFIPLNVSYSGDEMEERFPVFYHNAHGNRYSLSGVAGLSSSMQRYDYGESMIPSVRHPLDSVRVNLLDRWEGDNSRSSRNVNRAEYLDHLDTGLPKILNDRTLSTSKSFSSSVPPLETGNNWMDNEVQFISPSKYSGFSFCSPLLTQDRHEHQRTQLENEEALFHACVPPERKPSHEKESLNCDIENQTSRGEPFEDSNRKSVFSRLARKKSDKHIGYEEQDNDPSVDDIMAMLQRSSCMWKKSRVPTLPIQNLDDDQKLKKKRKGFSHELEVKEAFLSEKESDYPIPKETVFLDFKRRSQSHKSSDNLSPKNETKCVDNEDLSKSGQRKKRKLIRPNFHETGLLECNSNMKVQLSERCTDNVKVETSKASSASDENKDTVPGNVELLRAECEGDSKGKNGNCPEVSNIEALPSTSVQVSCVDSSPISA